ncbi:class I SAM-dependent methyltransferase [Aequorivita sp. SDUM287046]|uniref:Class I SAM-dependent methyltransferase n=1 Tax=Aequorivita aurantiaca TaxID=3053356 RepID=A0ABT8DHC4_9FLAO|nr:class I SAM-dependent methyltransferase [Aequorivita aurantiaca]MDN3724800.1 class I SAM-dependent methyltransferase [Aequorivita aurantiaca]
MPKNQNKPKNAKTPWPTKAAMEQVYEKKLWGGNQTDFYSGEGSHRAAIVNPYLTEVTAFLTSFKNKITVCDLGCGDFNVGNALVTSAAEYVAVDIVPSLIAHNKEKFKAPNLEFQCLDIAMDDLPSADCAILRQVLQHLSNAEIQSILKKLSNYKYIIITEHIPEGSFIPNKDIISGQGNRMKKQSGVNIFEPPFNFKVEEEKQLSAVVLNDGKGVIVTWVFRI